MLPQHNVWHNGLQLLVGESGRGLVVSVQDQNEAARDAPDISYAPHTPELTGPNLNERSYSDLKRY